MPTGFFPDEDVLKSQSNIKRYEHKGKVVNLYFDGVRFKVIKIEPISITECSASVESQTTKIIIFLTRTSL